MAYEEGVHADSFDVIEPVWISMRDGVRLMGRLWLPLAHATTPCGAVLEFIPYRLRDFMRSRDEPVGSTLAAATLAYLRVDLRGTGDSQGAATTGEYREQEIEDALDLIEWISQQSWSNGSVGMRGLSWGGFNSLLLAAQAPPTLRAIVAHGASDSMFEDDAHYVGGCLAHINFIWGVQFGIRLFAPPDPRITGQDWRKVWFQRLNGARPIMAEWLQHQRDDAYWQQGSVANVLERIRCPVYLVGGLTDGYRNAVPKMLGKLPMPHKALVGPWSHMLPDFGEPGPAVAFLNEEIRWFRHWLDGVDTGVMHGPPLHIYVADKLAADSHPDSIPGTWHGLANFPTLERGLWCSLHNSKEDAAGWRPVGTGHLVGLATRYWFPYPAALGEELPLEQTLDDQNSTCYDVPLPDPSVAGPLRLIGRPIVRATVRSKVRVAYLVARLCIIRPDGTSQLLTYGVLNLAHRHGHDEPTPLDPGRAIEVEIPLNLVSYRIGQGERLRLAFSDHLWPMLWMPPKADGVEIDERQLRLWLPASSHEACATELPFDPGGYAPPSMLEILTPSNNEVRVKGPDALGNIEISERKTRATCRLSGVGTVIGADEGWHLSINEREVSSGRWEGFADLSLIDGDWNVGMRSEVVVRANAEQFVIEEKLVARESGVTVWERSWTHTVPRDLL